MTAPPGNINKTHSKPRILVAPLDWGLGHATRCIPLIHCLLQQGAEVFLAGEGAIAHMLATEFPQLTLLPLPGYQITYSRNPRNFALHLFRQLPHILLTIRREHQWLKKIQQTHHFDGIIADNRYGLYLKNTPSVLMTHQLQIIPGKKGPGAFATRINQYLINRFHACWVPDSDNASRLAGSLSVPNRKCNIPIQFLGPLSRLSGLARPEPGPLLILLSGPEPQRTLFEEQLLKWVQREHISACMVLGKPGAPAKQSDIPGLTVYNHLPTDQLNAKMLGAEMIIARCGYSTVMDLATLRKKAVLIPTPGQPEQEYLARYLSTQQWFTCFSQDDLTQYQVTELKKMMERIDPWKGDSQLEEVVSSWLRSLKPGP